MEIQLLLMGRTPLVLKNGETINPDHPATVEIAAITGKRKKTADDRLRIAELEWHAALYRDADKRLSYPTANVRKCLIEAGKITKQGKDVERSVSFAELFVPLGYEGPRDVKALYADEAFKY